MRGGQPLAGPSTVQVDLTDACNQNCIVCWLHAPDLKNQNRARVERQATLPWELFVTLLDELRELGTTEIYFAGGGEPLVHPRAWDALELSVRKGFTTSLHTNFSLVDDEGISRLLDIGVHYLTVSLWAGSEDTYLATHPGARPGDYNKIIERLTTLNRRKVDRPQAKLYHVLTAHNAHELTEMFRTAEVSGCEMVEFAVAETVPGGTEEHGLTSDLARSCEAELQPLLQRAVWRQPRLQGGDDLGRRLAALSEGRDSDDALVHEVPCFAGWTYSRVMADGRVIPCLKAHRIPSGNLHDESFAEIWRGRRQQTFRQAGRPLRKENALLAQIGNDEEHACGCERGCDNLADNRRIGDRLRSFSRVERLALRYAPLPLRNEP